MHPSSQQLYQVFDFTPEDLAANRGGQITDRQQQRLGPRKSKAEQVTVIVIGLVVGLIILAGGMLAATAIARLGDSIPSEHATGQSILIAIFYAVLALVFLGYVFVIFRLIRAASGSIKLLTVRDRFTPVGPEHEFTGAQMGRIGRYTVHLNAGQAAMLAPGQPHTFYLAARSGLDKLPITVLSVEP